MEAAGKEGTEIMCGYSGETPSAFWESTPRARKEHTCCECLSTIAIGETYHLAKGVWDGEFQIYRTCEICHQVRNLAHAEMRHGEGIAFECLWEEVGVEYEDVTTGGR